MKKPIIIFLVIIIVIIGVGVWYFVIRGKGEFKDWQTYRNEEYGFEVKYPGDFEIIERLSGYEKAFRIHHKETTPKNLDFVSIKTNVLLSEKSAEEVIAIWQEDKTFTLIDTKELTISGKKTKVFCGEFLMGGRYSCFLRMVHPFTNEIYEIHFGEGAGPEHDEAPFDITTVNQILSTFKFVE